MSLPLSMPARGRLLLAAMLAWVWLQVGAAAAPVLVYPDDNAVSAGNTPSLAWAPVDAESIDVSIDGIPVATLRGSLTRYVPFPLSFGAHRWSIATRRGGIVETSPERHFVIEDRPLQKLPDGALLLRRDWAVQSSELAGSDGAVLSTPGVELKGWAATSVPATVLTALVRNGVYPNPYVALNNTRIPDANDHFNATYQLLGFSHLPGKNPWSKPYWFRTQFVTPASYAGKRIWLTFNEINYRAEIWLNGAKIATASDVVGMDRTFRFDVTSKVRSAGENTLAVEIYPLDEPGEPAPAPVTPLADPGRNMGADAVISHNYSKWDTIGWDWQPEVRDRDMGITEDVYLSTTADLEISEPYVTSDLPLPDTSRAELTVECDVVNHGAARREGVIEARICNDKGESVTVSRSFAVEAGAASHVVWTPYDTPALRVQQPLLWWPTGMGEPNLYTLDLALESAKEQVKAESVRFGIRKLETRMSPVTNTRIFSINGRDFFAKGGNWVIDMMLNSNATRYDQEIEIARRSNLNFLRVWGPTGAPPSAFYEAADRAGMLIWQDFLHDHWGTEQNQKGFEPELSVFEAATTAIIKKYRNHPSLFLWCGGNEGPNPREELIMKKLLPTFDPRGSRFYLKASLVDGISGGGPYDTLSPLAYFTHPKSKGFSSEIGPSGVPEWESIQQFLTLPPTQWAEGRFPLDGEWAYHDATDRDDDRKFSHYDTLLRKRFGAAKGEDLAAIRDYVETAQAVNYDVYRASVEVLNKKLWTGATGFAFWKYNSSWPSLIWQLDDWYLQLHAGFYATRRACASLHVQYHADDRTIGLVNQQPYEIAGSRVVAELFDVRMNRVWQHEEVVSVGASSVRLSDWAVPAQPGVVALKLRWLGAKGEPLSDNLYWLSDNESLVDLRLLPRAALEVKASRSGKTSCKVVVRNTSPAPARLVRLRWMHRGTDVELLPNYWSDNYVTLLPGDEAVLAADAPEGEAAANTEIEVSGPNLETRRIVLGP